MDRGTLAKSGLGNSQCSSFTKLVKRYKLEVEHGMTAIVQEKERDRLPQIQNFIRSDLKIRHLQAPLLT